MSLEGCLAIVIAVLASEVFSFRELENHGVTNPGLVEGDMLLSPAQRLAIAAGGDVSKAGIRGRASIRGNLWPGGVLVYTIDRALARNRRAMDSLLAGMKLWTDKTCIRFKERTNERNYATFHIGAGCTSYVGVTGSRQMISLASGCWYPYITSHEIGHALGFYHEQSRPDRDDYVNIYWNNIQKGYAFAFHKYQRTSIDSLGTPYDYASIMHYERYDFSKNRKPTIVAKNGAKLSNHVGPSEIDYRQMNLLYKCSGTGGGTGGGSTGGGTGGGGTGGGGGGEGGGGGTLTPVGG